MASSSRDRIKAARQKELSDQAAATFVAAMKWALNQPDRIAFDDWVCEAEIPVSAWVGPLPRIWNSAGFTVAYRLGFVRARARPCELKRAYSLVSPRPYSILRVGLSSASFHDPARELSQADHPQRPVQFTSWLNLPADEAGAGDEWEIFDLESYHLTRKGAALSTTPYTPDLSFPARRSLYKMDGEVTSGRSNVLPPEIQELIQARLIWCGKGVETPAFRFQARPCGLEIAQQYREIFQRSDEAANGALSCLAKGEPPIWAGQSPDEVIMRVAGLAELEKLDHVLNDSAQWSVLANAGIETETLHRDDATRENSAPPSVLFDDRPWRLAYEVVKRIAVPAIARRLIDMGQGNAIEPFPYSLLQEFPARVHTALREISGLGDPSAKARALLGSPPWDPAGVATRRATWWRKLRDLTEVESRQERRPVALPQWSEFQNRILRALKGKCLNGQALSNVLGVTPNNLSRHGMKALRDAKAVTWERGLGFYRPDDPPPEWGGRDVH